MSLRERIAEYARKHPFWINGGEYERLAMSVGFKASNCSRRLRELAEDGILERQENEKGHVEYRFKSPEKKLLDTQMNLIVENIKRTSQPLFPFPSKTHEVWAK